MRRALIHLWLRLHEFFYSFSWRVLLWLAGGEDELNEVFMQKLGCGRIDVTDDEHGWYPELRETGE